MLLACALLPALWLAHRLRMLRSRGTRWAAGLATLAAVATQLPWKGVDFLYLKRANLFLAGAVMLLLLLRHLGVTWAAQARPRLRVLAGLAVVSVVVYLDFFSFHGERTWVHYHDVVHYHLGSKYFAELGYESLYTALLRAEAETTTGNRFKAIEVRDLASNEVVHIRDLLILSGPVKAAFSPERWEEFKADATFFRERLGPAYATVLKDHGFNPTPAWALLGGALAGRVEAGSHAGVVVLTLLDPLLLAGAFAAVAWAFGVETALLAVIHFCVIYGSTFGWTGGAFLRYLWFFGVIVALSCLQKGRHGLAGALLGVACMLRVFPGLLTAGLAVKAGFDLVRNRRVSPAHLRFFAGFAATCLALFLATGAGSRGFGSWAEFRNNMRKHMGAISPNIVGLTPALSYRPGPATVTLEEVRAIQERQAVTYRVQLATFALAAVAALLLLSPRIDDVSACALGLLLVFTGLNLAAYYYAVLVALVLAHRERPLALLAVFGLELASHALLLFEERESMLFLCRSVLLAWLFAGLTLDELREARRRAAPEAEPPLPA